MCRCTHETSDLKLVTLFDRRNQAYCVCSHNLDADDASQEVAELRRDGLPAFTVDQHSRHVQVDPDECPACRAQMSSTQSGHCLPLGAEREESDSAADPTLNNHE